MKQSTEFLPVLEWDEFYGLRKPIAELTIVQWVEQWIINERMETWPKTEGFGSSDRWHVIKGALAGSDYDQDTKQFSQPETPEELKARYERWARNYLEEQMNGPSAMIDAFIDDPDAVISFFEPAA